MNRHSITILCMFCGRPPQCPLVLSRGWWSRASDTRGGRVQLPGELLQLHLVETQLERREALDVRWNWEPADNLGSTRAGGGRTRRKLVATDGFGIEMHLGWGGDSAEEFDIRFPRRPGHQRIPGFVGTVEEDGDDSGVVGNEEVVAEVESWLWRAAGRLGRAGGTSPPVEQQSSSSFYGIVANLPKPFALGSFESSSLSFEQTLLRSLVFWISSRVSDLHELSKHWARRKQGRNREQDKQQQFQRGSDVVPDSTFLFEDLGAIFWSQSPLPFQPNIFFELWANCSRQQKRSPSCSKASLATFARATSTHVSAGGICTLSLSTVRNVVIGPPLSLHRKFLHHDNNAGEEKHSLLGLRFI